MSIPKVVMRYGISGEARGGGLPRLVQSGDLEYETTIEDTILDLDEAGVYLFFGVATNKNTDAYSSMRTTQITSQTGEKFGVEKAKLQNILSDGTQRVSLTANTDGTVTLKPSDVLYHVRYTIYKMA